MWGASDGKLKVCDATLDHAIIISAERADDELAVTRRNDATPEGSHKQTTYSAD
jgi:hypothetical protein